MLKLKSMHKTPSFFNIAPNDLGYALRSPLREKMCRQTYFRPCGRKCNNNRNSGLWRMRHVLAAGGFFIKNQFFKHKFIQNENN